MRVLHGLATTNVGGVERIVASYVGALGERGVTSECFVYRLGPALDAFHSRCAVHTADEVDLGALSVQGGFDVLHLTTECFRLGALGQIARGVTEEGSLSRPMPISPAQSPEATRACSQW